MNCAKGFVRSIQNFFGHSLLHVQLAFSIFILLSHRIRNKFIFKLSRFFPLKVKGEMSVRTPRSLLTAERTRTASTRPPCRSGVTRTRAVGLLWFERLAACTHSQLHVGLCVAAGTDSWSWDWKRLIARLDKCLENSPSCQLALRNKIKNMLDLVLFSNTWTCWLSDGPCELSLILTTTQHRRQLLL